MAPTRSARLPLALLGLMTVASFGGPFVIVAAIRGGTSPHWPPDRAFEWWAFGLITGTVAVLMTACLALGLARWRKLVAGPKPGPEGDGARPSGGGNLDQI